MSFTMQLQVTGTKLVASSIPFLAEKTRNAVICRFTFDESWSGFSRTAIFRMGGHAVGGHAVGGQPLVALPLDQNDCAELPPALTACAQPFYLSVEGENGNCRLRTNTVCLSFERGECDGLPFTFYDGSYTLTENGTYPTSDKLMREDIRVEVPSLDLSQDTVTPETLAKGVTAHNSKKEKIIGTMNPYAGAKLHIECSASTPPTDQTKLWLKTDIQPKREFSGYLQPTQSVYGTHKLDAVGTVCCEGPDDSILVFGQYEKTPYLFWLYPDGTKNRKWKLDGAAADVYEWRALDMCFAGDRIYILLGSGGVDAETCRVVRVYVFDCATQEGDVYTTVEQDPSGPVYGGIAMANDGGVYLFVHRNSTYFYRYYTGTEIAAYLCDVSGYDGGPSGMTVGADGRLYTLLHQDATGDALCFDPNTQTVGHWTLACSNALDTSALFGGDGGYLFLKEDHSLFYLCTSTGESRTLALSMTGETGMPAVCCLAWRVAGDQLFLVMRDADGVLITGTLERTCSQPGIYLVQKWGDGALCTIQQTPVGSIGTVLSAALATDENGVWKPCPLYRCASDGQWTEIK